jgi:hypothetical protein
MKNLIYLVLIAFALACTNREAAVNPQNQLKKISFSFQGLKIGSGTLSGGRVKNDNDPTYLFIEIKKGNDLYATGVFKEIPKSLDLRLPVNTDFTANIKVIKKGNSYGILRTKNGNYTTINWSDAMDSLSYQFPIQNGADAGLCYVYTQPDSSANRYEYYPETDTYATQLTFNTNSIADTIKINLDRKVFGIESRIHNFQKGSVQIILAEEKSPTDLSGISGSVINYPDSTQLKIYSLMVLFPPRPNLRLRVIYNETEKDTVMYDGWIAVNALEKKILDIDLGRFNSPNGRNISVNLIDGELTDGELITIH